jgi:lysophospholipase L1-like esterase
MRALNVLLAFLVSVAIGLGVLELGLRILPGFGPPPTLNRPDPVTGWSKVPGRSITRRVAGEKIHFDINAHGLREDPGVGPAKPQGTYRVLALGDSFVLGYTVARADLFVDQLEGWWRSEERPIEIVNTGTEGWSTDQEAAWFRANGAAYAPDLVLLFPYENDVYWNGQEAYEGGYGKPRFRPDGTLETRALSAPRRGSVVQRSATVHFLRMLAGQLRSVLRPSAPEIRPEFTVLLTEPPPEYADWVARTEGALVALEADCAKVGARLVVCPIPSKSAVDPEEREFFRTWELGLAGLPDDRWSPDQPVQLFIDLAEKHGIDWLDPRPALAEATQEQGKLYFPEEVEWHFNALGNRVFATWLHDELERREILPPELAARTQGGIPEPLAEAGVPTFVLVFAALWAVLGTAYCVTYPKEPRLRSVLSVGAMLTAVFAIVLGLGRLVSFVPHAWTPWIVAGFVVFVLGFVAYKLGRRLGTIAELLRAFTLRGHWYLMPLVVVLLTIGSLLVVAASSPLIAPFIYTLF